MADGFMGRWSRRKLDAKEGRPLEPEPPKQGPLPSPQPAPSSGKENEGDAGIAASPAREEVAPAPEPPPTIDDVRALTADSDFSRFVRADVPADVKNAAVKKLFSDPHFNVMDRLDTYIDDYSQPDPIPESMLKQLVAGRFLGLFREEERKDEPDAGTREDAEGQLSRSVAQSQPPATDAAPPAPTVVPPDPHADPDLRLQQDDAARPGEAGRGTG